MSDGTIKEEVVASLAEYCGNKVVGLPGNRLF
jgi:hypothetical protein